MLISDPANTNSSRDSAPMADCLADRRVNVACCCFLLSCILWPPMVLWLLLCGPVLERSGPWRCSSSMDLHLLSLHLAGLSSFSPIGVFSLTTWILPSLQTWNVTRSSPCSSKTTTSSGLHPDNHDRCREEESSREGDEINQQAACIEFWRSNSVLRSPVQNHAALCEQVSLSV
jgi:hypothetical protein